MIEIMENKKLKLTIPQQKSTLEFLQALENSGQILSNKVLYSLSRNKDKISKILGPAMEANNVLVRQYGKDNGQGQIVVTPDNENYPTWKKESQELLSTMDAIDPFMIKYEEIDKMPGLRKCVVTRQTTVFYKYSDTTIYIVSLFDNRQNPQSLDNDINTSD